MKVTRANKKKKKAERCRQKKINLALAVTKVAYSAPLFLIADCAFVGGVLLFSVASSTPLSLIAGDIFAGSALFFFAASNASAGSIPLFFAIGGTSARGALSSAVADAAFADKTLFFLTANGAFVNNALLFPSGGDASTGGVLLSLIANDTPLSPIANGFLSLIAGSNLLFIVFSSSPLSSMFSAGFLAYFYLILHLVCVVPLCPLCLFRLLVLQRYLLEKDYLIKHL